MKMNQTHPNSNPLSKKEILKRGILGGLLGAIIAIAINVAITYNTDEYYPILVILIGAVIAFSAQWMAKKQTSLPLQIFVTFLSFLTALGYMLYIGDTLFFYALNVGFASVCGWIATKEGATRWERLGL